MILADHCVFATTIRFLRSSGFQVSRLSELAEPDTPDPEVLKLAVDRDWILLTNDGDFGNILLYPPSQHAGIIVLKILADTEPLVHLVLLRLLGDQGREGLRHRLAVVDRRKYRIRT